MAKEKRKKKPEPPPVELAKPLRLRPRRKLVALLSRKRSLYSTGRLIEAAHALGHRAIVLDTLRCQMVLQPGQPRMVYRGVEVRNLDEVIPRIGARIPGY